MRHAFLKAFSWNATKLGHYRATDFTRSNAVKPQERIVLMARHVLCLSVRRAVTASVVGQPGSAHCPTSYRIIFCGIQLLWNNLLYNTVTSRGRPSHGKE